MNTLMKKIFLAMCLVLVSIAGLHAVPRTAVVSGDWNVPATWGGTVPADLPADGDNVTIPVGITVTVPVGYNTGILLSSNFATLNVFGTLNVANNIEFVGHQADVINVEKDGLVNIVNNLNFKEGNVSQAFNVKTGGELIIGNKLMDGNTAAVNLINSGYIEIKGSIDVKQLTMTNNVKGLILIRGTVTGGGSSSKIVNGGIITTDLSLTLDGLALNNLITGKILVFGDINIKGSGTFSNSGFIQSNSFIVDNLTFFANTGTLVVLNIFDENYGGCPCNSGDAYIDPTKITVNTNPSACAGGLGCKAHWSATSNPPRVGSSLWYAADFIGYGQGDDGDPVKRWFDLANHFGFYMSDNTFYPVVKNNLTDNINFNPVLSFSGGEKHLDISSAVAPNNTLFSANATGGTSIFAVVVPKNGSNGNAFVLDYGQNPGAGFGVGYKTTQAYMYTPTGFGGAVNTYARVSDTKPILMSTVTKYSNPGTLVNQEMYLNGIIQSPSSSTELFELDDTQIDQGGKPVTIGSSAAGPKLTNDFEGNIAEIIVYSKLLSATDKQSIESYLAIKYGISMPNNYLSFAKTVVWTSDATYKFQIAGIAREDINFLDQRKSKNIESDAELTVSTTIIDNTKFNQKDVGTAFLDNSSYFIWGHNGKVVSSGMRKYKVVTTNFAQTVSMQFKVSGVPAGTKLIIDDNSDFSSPISSTSPSVAYDGTYLVYNGITFTNNSTLYCKLDLPVVAPGAVSASLEMWLAADGTVKNGVAAATDAQEITTWVDQTGLEANKLASGTGPTFFDALLMNYNPVAEFNGTSSGLNFGANNFFSTTGLSIFGVAKPYPTASKLNQFLVDYGNYNTKGYGLVFGDDNMMGYTSINSGGKMLSMPLTNVATSSLVGLRASLAQQSLFINGATISTDAIALTGLTDPDIDQTPVEDVNTGPLTIGMLSKNGTRANDNGRYFNGLLPEISLWTRPLSALEQQRVETYYAIKYGISLGKNYLCSDESTVIWDMTANAAYHNSVAGILRDDNSGLLQKQSKNENDIVAIGLTAIAASNSLNAGTITNDKQALVWGNNGGKLLPVLTGKPAAVPAIMERVWKATETGGDLGALEVVVTIAGGTGNVADYFLVIDTDNDGLFSDEVAPTGVIACSARNGNDYKFNCNLANGNRFTVGMPALLTATQEPGVGINTQNQLPVVHIHPSAHLHVYSTNKGVILSSMDNTGMNAIASPSKGLIVFNTTYNRYMFNAGTPGTPRWEVVGGPIKQSSYELSVSQGLFLGELRYNTTTKTIWYWEGSKWYELQ